MSRLFHLQLLCSLALAIGLSSCVNLKHNYLGVAKRDLAISHMTESQTTLLDTARRHLDQQMQLIVASACNTKQHHQHLSAGEINQLYTTFGSQLNYDRLYNSILQTGHTKKKKLSFKQRYAAAKLLLSAMGYDSTYQKNKTIRRTINRGDQGNHIPGNILQKSRVFLYSPSIRHKLSAGKKRKPDAADSLLAQLPRTHLLKAAYYHTYRHFDRFYGLLYDIFPTIGQQLFGKVGNRISNRIKQKKSAIQLQTLLQPYDILLSRAPGHLAAKVIPGYFGHAALWLGNEVPLKHRPFLKNIHKSDSVRTGIRQKGMAEALRNGVQLSRLIEYADADEYIIIRPRELTAEQKKTILLNTMKQMGKNYDFNFDIESPDMINCTELVYLAYDFREWKVRSFMGRYTLFPDDLLITALDNSSFFEITAFIQKGKK